MCRGVKPLWQQERADEEGRRRWKHAKTRASAAQSSDLAAGAHTVHQRGRWREGHTLSLRHTPHVPDKVLLLKHQTWGRQWHVSVLYVKNKQIHILKNCIFWSSVLLQTSVCSEFWWKYRPAKLLVSWAAAVKATRRWSRCKQPFLAETKLISLYSPESLES